MGFSLQCDKEKERLSEKGRVDGNEKELVFAGGRK
jgi:hypothetical protein